MRPLSVSRCISAALISVIALSGCSGAEFTESTSATTETTVPSIEETLVSESSVTTTSESAVQAEPLKFNTHVYSCFLDACYSEDYRESFFNLCDALQNAEDTFECANEEIYEFCMDPVTHNQLYPVACMQITDKSPDGSPSFENGTGHIYYTKTKEDFLERQARFQNDIMAIINSFVEPGCSDFEKCLVLYDYMACNYVYDYNDELDRSEDGSGCACLKYKKGICGDFAPLYSYLLLQSGVNAIAVSNWGENDDVGYHSWTYVDIDGKGYHIDPTWGLKEDKTNETFELDYFMMTDEDRAGSGYPPELLEVYLLPGFYANECKEYDFKADDKSYRLPSFSLCCGYDLNRDTLFYYDYSYNYDKHAFQYGDHP